MATSTEHGIRRRGRRTRSRARPLDDRRPRLRRRLRGDDGRDVAEPRGPAQQASSPTARASSCTTRCSRSRTATTSCRPGTTPRRACSIPFILVVEGAIGDERRSGEGHWTGFGVDPVDGQPITVNEWIDRLAPRAAVVLAVGTCATYGGVPAMKNNPTGAMGLPDFLGWGWQSRMGVPIVCIPGCPAQPDNMTSILLELVLFAGDIGPAPAARRPPAPRAPLRPHDARRLRPCRASPSRGSSRRPTATIRAASSSSAARAPRRSATSRRAAGSTASAAARTPAASASAARCPASPTSSCRSWTPTPGATRPRTSSASPTARSFAISASATSC